MRGARTRGGGSGGRCFWAAGTGESLWVQPPENRAMMRRLAPAWTMPGFFSPPLQINGRGAERTRTADFLLAKQVLYQLSYRPNEIPV